jgi:aryl-alcohol dehydrogenase-like predicted oxidoreductase
MATETRRLGRTGLAVGRMGISAGYGVPTAAVERAVDHGVNYLYWGSRRTAAFAQAVRNLKPKRESFVLVVQSYSRFAGLLTWSLERALRTLTLDYADVLLLGLWNKPVSPAILEAAHAAGERGLVRHLALSTHKRPMVPMLAAGTDYDVIHFRYNAAHAGAEQDIFPQLPGANRPGLVAFTATSWRQLLKSRKLAAGERVPSAADCYRFVLSRPEVDVCMSGPSSAAHVDSLIEAIDRGPLDPDEMAWMRRVGQAVSGKVQVYS